jgi:hypothetical protein
MSTPNWTVTLEEDPDTGEVILPLPDDMLEQLGWKEGIPIYWIDNKDGTYTLTDKEQDVISN